MIFLLDVTENKTDFQIEYVVIMSHFLKITTAGFKRKDQKST